MFYQAPGLLATQLSQPFNEQGKHADFYRDLNPRRYLMVDRKYLDPDSLEGSEAAFSDHEPFVATGGILKADRVIILSVGGAVAITRNNVWRYS